MPKCKPLQVVETLSRGCDRNSPAGLKSRRIAVGLEPSAHPMKRKAEDENEDEDDGCRRDRALILPSLWSSPPGTTGSPSNSKRHHLGSQGLLTLGFRGPGFLLPTPCLLTTTPCLFLLPITYYLLPSSSLACAPAAWFNVGWTCAIGQLPPLWKGMRPHGLLSGH